MTGQKIAALLLSLLAFLFAAVAGWTAIGFLMADGWLAKTIGISVLLVIVAGVWGIGREIWFGVQTQKLARILEADDDLPEDNLPRVKGRIDRDAADAHFQVVKADLLEDPNNWRSWFKLSVAYDDASDRKRARQSMRHSIKLYNITGN